jgi:hypothetical protein
MSKHNFLDAHNFLPTFFVANLWRSVSIFYFFFFSWCSSQACHCSYSMSRIYKSIFSKQQDPVRFVSIWWFFGFPFAQHNYHDSGLVIVLITITIQKAAYTVVLFSSDIFFLIFMFCTCLLVHFCVQCCVVYMCINLQEAISQTVLHVPLPQFYFILKIIIFNF